MDDPPAPEIGDRERLLDPGQRDHAENVENSDVEGRGPDQVFEADGPTRTAGSPGAARGPSATARGTPARSRSTGRERSRSARTVRAGCRKAPGCRTRTSSPSASSPVAHDAEPIADQSAGDDNQGDPKQEIDQQPLAARFTAAGDRRREKQPGADPATAIQMIGAWRWMSRRKLNGRTTCRSARRSCGGRNRRGP